MHIYAFMFRQHGYDFVFTKNVKYENALKVEIVKTLQKPMDTVTIVKRVSLYMYTVTIEKRVSLYMNTVTIVQLVSF